MNSHVTKINNTIAPLRDAIVNHQVYSAIKDVEDLQTFMKYHIYAVWDFMSLLKSLQRNLTCTSVPWFPVGDADTRFLINEIVAGEESDIDPEGNRKSHFELYLEAMRQCGADLSQIETFTSVLQATSDFEQAHRTSETPAEAKAFVDFTFEIINSGKNHLQSAIFTFGREDLIPGMFISLVNDMHRQFPDSVSIFKYYLERHIEVDGDHHSHLALDMTSKLCGDNEAFWDEALEATVTSLQKRLALWDGACREIMLRKHAEVL
ncbi:MAG: heme oxygenase [Flavobacterium sp. BFFFF1]|uniref:DUF3050 domain-containing protein n=1 Tax=Flavobacterium sp. BFFFF1 TaxID=2015557 RepID=UPI000BCED4FD|nr:DUF3050 domain-containing protein [Flavobacterium sp. BFFFF1]OYU80690.1 MAG: heme oxygenase [Flavobacterium sp. BFFFF1]